MSNIANQLVAVVATLSGFVAHDLLSQRAAAPTIVAAPTISTAAADVKNRSLALDGLSVEDWLDRSPRAERTAPRAPAVALAIATTAAGPVPLATDAVLADPRVNDARFDGADQASRSAFLR